ncbi:MAG: hypothetical protein QXI10_01990 [Candidatus Diapherotrites archaeon]
MFSFFLAGYFWDFLRPITEFAKQIDLPVKVIIFILAIFIFFISVMSYRRSGSRRILLISFAFFLFSLKLLIKLIDYFYSPGTFLSDSSENIFELGILLFLFVALFYGRKGKKFFAPET